MFARLLALRGDDSMQLTTSTNWRTHRNITTPRCARHAS
jgi:hypothetical protein